MTYHFARIAAAPTALLLALVACGGGGSGSGTDSGVLRVALTDAPSCGYDNVNVTVQKVRVHLSGAASDTDAGWSEVVLSPPRRLDLLALSNGVLAELGQTSLPAGRYTQMRLVLVANDSNNPFANAVIPTGSTTEVALRTPSAQQSGLKMNVGLDIAADKLVDVVIDFDACKSIVAAGASGNYILKPVLSVIPRYASGVAGFVDSTAANGSTSISVQQAGVVVKATAPDSAGKFILQPVAPGTYDLVLTAPSKVTTVIAGVRVTTDTATLINSSTTQLFLAGAGSGTAAGTVSSPISPIDATVRATQTLANAARIEIVARSVNATTGVYSYALPASAPMVATFVSAQGPLAFAADATAGAKYSLEASSAGVTKAAGPITVTPGATLTNNFGF